MLDSQRAQFRNGQLSGFFEIQAMPQELEVLIFAGGEQIGTYRLWPNSLLKITPSEIGIGWDRQEVPIRAVALPDQAGRAIWQALEFQFLSQKEIVGLAEWKGFLGSCRTDRLTGMVEVTSEACDGFVFLYEGLPVVNESVFCSSEGFTSSLQVAEGYLDGNQQLTIYKTDPATQAYQCAFLRMSVVGWGNRILSNYQGMVGQKLLNILNANMNAILIHQQSNIHLVDTEIIDNHFFYESEKAAEAYRTLFQDMSQLISRVIGGMVTRRIMSTTFEQLDIIEQDSLTARSLTPATFLR